MEFQHKPFQENPLQAQNNVQRSLQDNFRDQNANPSIIPVINIQTQSDAKNQPIKKKQHIVEASKQSFNFSEERYELRTFGKDEIRAQGFTQEAFDNIMTENLNLKNEVTQLKRKLNSLGEKSSSFSQGTQEEETKKNPQQENSSKQNVLNQCLEAGPFSKKVQRIDIISVDALRLDLQKTLNIKYQKKLEQQSSQINNLKSINNQLTLQLTSYQKLNAQKEKLQRQNKKCKDFAQGVQKQNQILFNVNQSLREEQNKLQDQRLNISQKISKLQEEIDDCKALVAKLKQQVTNLNKQNNMSKQKCENSRQQIQKLNKESQVLIKQIQDYKRQIQNLNKESQILKKQIQDYKRQIQRLNNKLKEEIEKHKQQMAKQRSQKSKLQAQVKSLNNEKEALKKQVQEQQKLLKKQKEDRQTDKNKFQKQIDALNIKINSLRKQLGQLQKQKGYLEQQKQQLLRSLQDYKQVLHPIMEVSGLNLSQGKNKIYPKFLRGNYFPDSFILNNQSINKSQFLCQQLKKFLQVPSFKTYMLFKYDPINPLNNYSRYISGKKHIMLLIKLVNGRIIGGFSVFPFEEQPKKPGKGFIFSLTAERVFKMKKDPRVGVYTPDSFFIIIGSSELRIKYTEKKFFSNFGVANCTFDPLGYTRQQFIGSADNEVEFQSYEIYTIDTDQE